MVIYYKCSIHHKLIAIFTTSKLCNQCKFSLNCCLQCLLTRIPFSSLEKLLDRVGDLMISCNAFCIIYHHKEYRRWSASRESWILLLLKITTCGYQKYLKTKRYQKGHKGESQLDLRLTWWLGSDGEFWLPISIT